MLIRDARARLLEMLADGGVTPGAATGADTRALVEVYRRFASIPADDAAPVDEDGDGILTQFGTYSFRGPREISADFTGWLAGAARPGGHAGASVSRTVGNSQKRSERPGLRRTASQSAAHVLPTK